MPTPTATIMMPYSALDDVLLRGTRATQPAGSAVTPGTLYAVTDEGTVEQSTGSAWAGFGVDGRWTAIPWSAGIFTANAGTWTVETGDLVTLQYTRIGKTLWITFWLQNTSVSGGPTELRLWLPSGLAAAVNAFSLFGYADAGAPVAAGYSYVAPGSLFLGLRRDPLASTGWSAATNTTSVLGNVCLPIQ